MKLGNEFKNVSLSTDTFITDDLFNNFKSLLTPTLIKEYESAETEEDKSSVLNEDIMDYLNEISPDGCYFGSHPGNGSDFGFWEVEQEDDILPPVKFVRKFDKTDFTLKPFLEEFGGINLFLCRKDVPLIRMGCDLDEIDIYLLGGEIEDGEKEPYIFAVRDHVFGDYYTYGSWETIEEFDAWFENPVSLY